MSATLPEPTGRSLPDREVDVHRALCRACDRAGYTMEHVSDAPEAYGADAATPKHDGTTLTSWVVAERRV